MKSMDVLRPSFNSLTALRIASLWDWMRGPYGVWERRHLVKTRWVESETQVRTPTVAGRPVLEFELDASHRLVEWIGPWKRVLFDGTGVEVAGAKIRLSVSGNPENRLFEVVSNRSSLGFVKLRAVQKTMGLGALLQETGTLVRLHGLRVLAALLLHTLIFALGWPGLFGSSQESNWNETPLEMASADQEPQAETAAAPEQQSAPTPSLEDAFAGSLDRAFKKISPTQNIKARVAQGTASNRGLFGSLFSQAGSARARPQLAASDGSGAIQKFSAQDLELLHAVISRNQERTRNCYEKALLADESLSVNAQYEADLIATSGGARLGAGRYQWKGEGSGSSKAQLGQCIDQVLMRETLPARFSGTMMRYTFVFKS